ncbi:MAG: hypothetical protein NVS1B2_25920 [Vulcanimicrobiaceae bacterium]
MTARVATSGDTVAAVRAAAVALALAIVALPTAVPAAPMSAPAAPPVHDTFGVRGALLAIADDYVVFTSGTVLRLRPHSVIAPQATLGETVRVTVDRATHEALAISPGETPRAAGDVAIADLPVGFGVTVVGAIERHARRTDATGAAVHRTITLTVDVPANTPPNADAYVATDRSAFGPAEIRMQRVGARRFSVVLTLDRERVRYEFTRGSAATIERDRRGGVVEPRTLDATSAGTVEDTVRRWADRD